MVGKKSIYNLRKFNIYIIDEEHIVLTNEFSFKMNFNSIVNFSNKIS